MAEIVKLKKDGVTQYPVTKPECVIDENGKNVLQLIRENAGGGAPMINITYANLVKLRNNSKLIAGMQYRITDFVTTTAQENTRSAENQFDVIVTADNENTLNEVARACCSDFDIEKYKDAYSPTWSEKMTYIGLYQYEGKEYHLYESASKDMQMLVDFKTIIFDVDGASNNDQKEVYPFTFKPTFAKPDEDWDTGENFGEIIAFKNYPEYFAKANLAAWQIWYSLDNDTQRFAWADAQNGKGVIYRMIDEWNNDIPYDFKNIIYVEKAGFKYTQWGGDHQFMRDSLLDKVIDGTPYYGYSSMTTPTAWSEGKCWVTDENVTPETQLYNADGSAISYGGTISNIITNDVEYYTFRKANEDDSLYGITKDNVVETRFQNGTQLLNKNIFGVGCYSNKLGNDSFNNTFGDYCHYNILLGGVLDQRGATLYCKNNTFGNRCYLNVFGYTSFNNSFGENCYLNTFGNNCFYNTFGNSCYSNSFGNDCANNIFEDSCYANSFKNNCCSNSFGEACNNNSFNIGIANVGLNEGANYKTASINSNNEVKVFNLADLADLLNS